MTIKRYDINDDGLYVSMEPRETGRFVKHDDHLAALRREREPVEIDIRHSMMDQIEAAASESPWVPPEYYMNEVVYDLCAYLRNPRVDHLALVAAAYRDAANIVTRAGHSLDAEILARTPADAQAALTAIERAAYERGVQSALQHIRTWMELEAEDRGEADAEYPLERQCAPILALLTQEGR